MNYAIGPVMYVVVAVAAVLIMALRLFLHSSRTKRDIWHTTQGVTEADVEAAIRGKRTIEAIRLYRHLHGCSLKEAKDAVEALAARLERIP